MVIRSVISMLFIICYLLLNLIKLKIQKMKAQELLIPRFEVIGEYPKCEFLKGELLVRIKYATNDVYHKDEHAPVGGLDLAEIEKFPHLFQPLNWWEKRKKEDMPMKLISKANSNDTEVIEIEEWDMDIMVGWIDKAARSCCSLLSWKPKYGYFPVD